MSAAAPAAGGERESGRGAISRLAAGLALAATPAFAAMAVFTALAGEGPMQAMCAPHGLPALGGMAPMYALMSAFHLGAWLRFVADRPGFRGQDATPHPPSR
ncbi:hypothetical protein ACO2Q3_21410 [Caulobacter sp. KR2-114]|uniref:hypothetical protein n=1 Tax=Caulobacter sp. KR2-114 TaxID=3400912 RepID=UPI003C07BD4D